MTKFLTALLGVTLLLGACTTDPTTGVQSLTPAATQAISVACTLDKLAPGTVATVGAITSIADPATVGAVVLANQADALAHPAVVAACAAALPGSTPLTVTPVPVAPAVIPATK